MVYHPSIECILPPYMLKQIVDQGSSEQREWAVRTLRLSDQIRSQRLALASTLMAPEQHVVAGGVKRRTVYDAQQGSTLPGSIVRNEGDLDGSDPAVNEAYTGAGATYDLYWEIYQRNSIDDKGMTIESSVHYQKNYDNAFWNGSQMVYGDGDSGLTPGQQLFNRFTISIDIIGHELTHGVTQFTANLTYQDEPGALNESISDVFGSLVKQRQLSQTAAEADWIIGQGLFTPNVKGVGIRSMKAPGTAYDDPVLGKDPQPANMKDYNHLPPTDDSGGVHINSGIPNFAFYSTALAIGGNAWEKAGRIWYKTLIEQLKPASNFQDTANLTLTVAGELYGKNSLEQQAVVKGWAAAGITAAEIDLNPGTNTTGCQNLLRGLFKINAQP
jgi:Zn-dependent metalloprotease